MWFTQFLRTFALGKVDVLGVGWGWGQHWKTFRNRDHPPSPHNFQSIPRACRHPFPHQAPWLRHHEVCFDQKEFCIKKKKILLPLILPNPIYEAGETKHLSHLQLPGWPVAIQRKRFQVRLTPTLGVRAGRHKDRETWWQWELKTDQGRKFRIWSPI